MRKFEWTNSLIADLHHMRIGDTIFVEGGIIECRRRDYACKGCALLGSGRCNDIDCSNPIRLYEFTPNGDKVGGVDCDGCYIDEAKDMADSLGNLQGTTKEPDIIDKMNISYKRERFAFLSMVFMIGSLGAIVALTIIDLIRYVITVGLK